MTKIVDHVIVLKAEGCVDVIPFDGRLSITNDGYGVAQFSNAGAIAADVAAQIAPIFVTLGA